MTFAERYAQLARARESLAAIRRFAPALEPLWRRAEAMVDGAQARTDAEYAAVETAMQSARQRHLRLVREEPTVVNVNVSGSVLGSAESIEAAVLAAVNGAAERGAAARIAEGRRLLREDAAFWGQPDPYPEDGLRDRLRFAADLPPLAGDGVTDDSAALQARVDALLPHAGPDDSAA